MPTLRSQTASSLKGKNPYDISELSVSPNPSPSCLGPGTPAQEHEPARADVADVTPVVRRSGRVKAEVDKAAAAATSAEGALGLSRRRAKCKRETSSVEEEGASPLDTSAGNIVVDWNKGKRKAEEQIEEGTCEVSPDKITLEGHNAKSGESSLLRSRLGKVKDSDSQVCHEVPDFFSNRSPDFVTTRGRLRSSKAFDQEIFVHRLASSTKRGRGREKGRRRSGGSLVASNMDGQSTSYPFDEDESKVPLLFDLNQSPGGSSNLDEVHEEPGTDGQLAVAQVSARMDLNVAEKDDDDVDKLAEEETGAHKLMDVSHTNLSVEILASEAGPSHRPQEEVAAWNRGGRGRVTGRRAEAFLQIARDRAFHFAHFDADGDQAPAGAPPRVDRAASRRRRGRQPGQLNEHRPQSQPQAVEVDWPGPFSTARQLVNNRAMAAAARQNAGAPESKVLSMIWSPSRVPGTFSSRECPSLQDLCLGVLANNAENVESLEGVPDLVRLQISNAFCERRKMTPKVFSLFFQGEPSELQSLDCTQISEDELREMMKQICPSRLEKLHLGNCGRAVSEHCLLATIARPSILTALKSVSFRGAYRLSDQGLEALLLASPLLVHLDLSTCSFLTDASVNAMARCVSGTLESLVLDGCTNLNASVFVHDLVRMPKLQKISLSEVGGVTDDIVSEICVQLGLQLRELVLARCTSLTDAAIAAIGPCCPSLQVLNLAHLSLLTDVAIAHITDNLRKIQDLNLRRCKFSDEAIATFVTASGGALLNLSLNAVQQIADQTLLALARHSHTCLERLDLSFCRLVDDECLGFLADACLQLHELKLYGCTQVTEKFLTGHSNCNLKIIGVTSRV